MGKQKRSENTYQKIQTVFKRDEKNVIMPFAELTQPEFDFLRDKPWRCEEKIDGTNIRLEVQRLAIIDDEECDKIYPGDSWEQMGRQESDIKGVKFEVSYKGKTDNADINPRLMKHLTETYPKKPPCSDEVVLKRRQLSLAVERLHRVRREGGRPLPADYQP